MPPGGIQTGARIVKAIYGTAWDGNVRISATTDFCNTPLTRKR